MSHQWLARHCGNNVCWSYQWS